MVENEMDSKIKFLIYDNGGEFTSKEFMDIYRKHGIVERMELLKERTRQYMN
jgi:hypothetical protein